ncbi:MAG: beta-glucosidase [Sphingobacteriales bacterium UTBCD1]|jgi:hypothetical protein|nr:MAG: beta-glucosidase [Sphingobacteriales bacterium UTBCD1]
MRKIGFNIFFILLVSFFFAADCNKKNDQHPSTPPVLKLVQAKLDNTDAIIPGINYNVRTAAAIYLKFNNALDRNSVVSSVSLKDNGSLLNTVNYSYVDHDSVLVITPSPALKNLAQYNITVTPALKSVQGGSLVNGFAISFITQIDSTDKFPIISDSALLDLVEQKTFRYFWDFGHPVSGLARERSNEAPETVTTGGSGFGIMAIPVAIHRNFITRDQGLTRMQTIVAFLKNTAQKFHGAFPHWLNGTTGQVIPFSTKDNGADIVETSYLMAGLLTARQFFDGMDAAETNLRNDINSLWNAVEWTWFQQGGQKVLYWHWSPDYGWAMNMKIEGWNECLITYILAASSNTNSITQEVYTQGFAGNGAEVNNNSYYGYRLPLGPAFGGPLFWSHYSFLGIDPFGLSDAFADYQTQVINHTRINHQYCVVNPKDYFGYSDFCWGLTASDVPNGYNANEPNNDIGVISPTAALSSFPYTPAESMNALKFFYYKLGDKIWGQYGFADAFSLKDLWYANSNLAIDEGPIIIMIENYRSKLLWNLFMSCPEIKEGLKKLGFNSPHLP